MGQIKFGANLPWVLKRMANFTNVFGKDDCKIGVYLAAAKEIEKENGVFYNDKMQMVPLNKYYDEAIGKKLWRISEELTDNVS